MTCKRPRRRYGGAGAGADRSVTGKFSGNSLKIILFFKLGNSDEFSDFPIFRKSGGRSGPARDGSAGGDLFSNALETKGIFNGPAEWRQPTRACHHFPFFWKDTKAAITRTASDNGLRPLKFPCGPGELRHRSP